MDHNYFKFKNKRSSHTAVIKLVVLVSVFSLVFSFLPLLLQSLNQFFNFFTINAKSYMFLLCNGLLVFIANNSGLITSTPQPHIPTQTPEIGISQFKEELHVQAEDQEENEAENPQEQEDEEDEEEEERGLVMEDSQKEEEEDGNNGVMIMEEEQEEEENEAEVEEDAEELNKKCEDFIRKMKAAFCSEPRDYYYYNHKSLVAVM